MINMEIFTTFGLFFLFSFLYVIGWFKEDFVLELMGAFGFLLLGIIWFATGLQIPTIDPSTGTLYERTLGTASLGGFIIGIFGAILLLYCGKSISETASGVGV